MIPHVSKKQHSDKTKELARARVAAGESLSRVALNERAMATMLPWPSIYKYKMEKKSFQY